MGMVKTIEYDHRLNPGQRFIHGGKVSKMPFLKFLVLIYRGLNYSLYSLQGPSKEYIEKKSLILPDNTDQNTKSSSTKFLFLGLDQVLVHFVGPYDQADAVYSHEGNTFRFNIRPYCL